MSDQLSQRTHSVLVTVDALVISQMKGIVQLPLIEARVAIVTALGWPQPLETLMMLLVRQLTDFEAILVNEVGGRLFATRLVPGTDSIPLRLDTLMRIDVADIGLRNGFDIARPDRDWVAGPRTLPLRRHRHARL